MTRDEVNELVGRVYATPRELRWWRTVRRSDLGDVSAAELWELGCERTVIGLALKLQWRVRT